MRKYWQSNIYIYQCESVYDHFMVNISGVLMIRWYPLAGVLEDSDDRLDFTIDHPNEL